MPNNSVIMMANGGFGDVACSTCLLYHREKLWPGKRLIWLVHPTCEDILKFNDKIDEVMIEVSPEVRKQAEKADIDIVNTAPWANPGLVQQGIPYAQIPMRVLKSEFKEWHPYLKFSEEEDARAEAFIKALPFPRTIILETSCRSGQSSWNSTYTEKVIRACKGVLGSCNFLFASKTGFDGVSKQSAGFEGAGVTDLSSFTIRQCLPIFNRSHLMVGISSGLSCSVCSWQANPSVERVELVYNRQYGTWPMARGPLATTTNMDEMLGAVETAARRIK